MARAGDPLRWTANVLTDVGERRGIDWLTYNPLRMAHFHSAARRNAPAFVRALRAAYPDARSWVDVGCGSGAYVAEATRQGIAAVGCERSRVGRLIARAQGADARPFDLTRSPPTRVSGPFDLAYSIEVVEHIPPELGDGLVELLCELAPQVVFSAATPGQGGIGHINEQPPEYWDRRFRERGYVPVPETTERVHAVLREAGVDFWLYNARAFERASG
jgi:SAM-dependent methyltransferase